MKETEARKVQYENLEQKQKEELISVLIYSASIITDEADRTKEFSNIISLAKMWKVNVEEKYGFTEKTDLSKINAGNIRRKIRVKNLMSIVADIASNFDFFDRQEGLEKELKFYKGMMQEMGFSDEGLKSMTFGSKDYANQFLNEDLKRIEYLANTMYLVNQIAHIIQISPKQVDFIDARNAGINLYESFMRIKDNCIKEAIKEKQKGENVRISIYSHKNALANKNANQRYDEAINIDIPGYLAPFSVHFDKTTLTRKEILSCDKNCEYFIKGYRYNFPLKLTEEKAKLLEDLYNRKIIGGGRDKLERLKWTIELLHSNFSQANKKKIITKPENTKREYKGKGLFKARDNKSFIERMQEKVEFRFPEYLKDGLMHRASYSFEDFADKIKPYAIKKLREQGFKKRRADREFYKIFMHMRMTKNISYLRRLPEDSDLLKEKVEESLGEYGESFKFITENADKFSDYNTLRKGVVNLYKDKEGVEKQEIVKRKDIEDLLLMTRKKKNEIAILEKQLQEAREEYDRLQAKAIRELGKMQERDTDNPSR